ncbi:MAG: hypothetical protein K9H16_06675 [Bacteroidales bacterium]|nr:hypothetical protein [Bacteroidales bacterium]
MKRTLFLFILTLLLKVVSHGQTPFYSEDFNSAEGWQLDANWQVQNGQLQFYWTPTISNFDLSAISSEIQLPSTVQEIIVSQYLNVFGTSTPPELAEIYIVASGNETLLWSHSLDNGNWGFPGGQEISLNIGFFGGETVRFRFRTHGLTTYNWNDWNIYNFTLTSMLSNDLAVVGFDGSTLIDPEYPGTWDVEIKNLGSLPQSNFTLKLLNMKNGVVLDEIQVVDEIQSQQSAYFSFDWMPEFIQHTVICGLIESEEDEYSGNNRSESFFVRVIPDIDFSILVWDNDNDIQTITDPELGDAITPATGITRALEAGGFDFEYVNYLPGNYSDFDVIIATLGCYCLS